MEAVLYRTGSGSIASKLPAPPRVPSSPNNITSLHINGRRRIRRSSSESDITIRCQSTLIKQRSFHQLPPLIPQDDTTGFSCFPAGGGMNNNRRSSGGGRGGHSSGDRCEIGAYYENMLKSDPINSLLLINYGKYLHEVEGNFVKAEECYGRAILASPGDGQVLSLYGKLIWESQRDGSRAESYFNQALQVAPHDCSVLGSYAHFLWEVEDDEEEEELGRCSAMGQEISNAAMVEAF